MAHYSQTLKAETAAEQEKIARAKEVMNMFRAHLASSKFWNDTTIQVSDVNRWLDSINTQLNGDY